jgi:hypothetical protein
LRAGAHALTTPCGVVRDQKKLDVHASSCRRGVVMLRIAKDLL